MHKGNCSLLTVPLYCIFFVELTVAEVYPPFSLILHSVRSDLLCSNSTEATNITPDLQQSECKEDQFTPIFFWINTRRVFAEISSALFE